MSTHPKALLYRASHRGTKENDLILGPFAEKYVHKMSDQEREIFEEFLECADEDIYYWIRCDHLEVPEKYRSLIKGIRQDTHL